MSTCCERTTSGRTKKAESHWNSAEVAAEFRQLFRQLEIVRVAPRVNLNGQG